MALMQEIMRRASRVILNPTADGTIELRTDAKIIRHPGRFTDSRGDRTVGNRPEAAGRAAASGRSRNAAAREAG